MEFLLYLILFALLAIGFLLRVIGYAVLENLRSMNTSLEALVALTVAHHKELSVRRAAFSTSEGRELLRERLAIRLAKGTAHGG